jgi:hypothetical protein
VFRPLLAFSLRLLAAISGVAVGIWIASDGTIVALVGPNGNFTSYASGWGLLRTALGGGIIVGVNLVYCSFPRGNVGWQTVLSSIVVCGAGLVWCFLIAVGRVLLMAIPMG